MLRYIRTRFLYVNPLLLDKIFFNILQRTQWHLVVYLRCIALDPLSYTLHRVSYAFCDHFLLSGTLLHASLRMRSIKNKISGKAEAVGFKTSPMGMILKAMDQDY